MFLRILTISAEPHLNQARYGCMGRSKVSAAMWMELGLLGAVGLLPVIVVVAIFQAANLRRGRKLGPSPEHDWLSSSELRGPD